MGLHTNMQSRQQQHICMTASHIYGLSMLTTLNCDGQRNWVIVLLSKYGETRAYVLNLHRQKPVTTRSKDTHQPCFHGIILNEDAANMGQIVSKHFCQQPPTKTTGGHLSCIAHVSPMTWQVKGQVG